LNILDVQQTKIITLVVAISMLYARLLLIIYESYINSSHTNKAPDFDDANDITPTQNVIIAGYGRFGQIIGRLLHTQGYHLSVLDHSPAQIEMLRRFDNEVFYGDAARKDLLEASGASQAQLLVVAVDDTDKSIELIELAQKHYSNLKIVARAIDRSHAYQLMHLNVHAFKRETFDSAVNLGIDAL
jgi:glutathione-regulated potassium-efflux system ancillary protein KefC